jgi:hypothetical protein
MRFRSKARRLGSSVTFCADCAGKACFNPSHSITLINTRESPGLLAGLFRFIHTALIDTSSAL